jgi:NhaP-type Na+/H+ or K+/H+ antiporter
MPLPQLVNSAGVSGGRGVSVLVAAGIVYEIIAANCSSPQTTELNAKDRADTLMKYVHLGLVQSALFIFIAASLDKQHRREIILGGGLAATIMYGLYFHAKVAGLASDLPGTEEHSNARSGGGNWWGSPT